MPLPNIKAYPKVKIHLTTFSSRVIFLDIKYDKHQTEKQKCALRGSNMRKQLF